MNFFLVLLPFLGIGFTCALLSRFTGVAVSMLVVPSILYMGATPIEAIAFMMAFALYHNFTVVTQETRLSFKELYLFKGWKLAIPLLITALAAFVDPFLGVAVFVAFFIAELIMFTYHMIPQNERPETAKLVIYFATAAVWCLLGLLIFQFIPAAYFLYVVGVAILGLTAFAWQMSRDRNALKSVWSNVWGGLHIFLGALGLEISSYAEALRRQRGDSKLERFTILATIVAAFVGVVYVFVMYQQISLPALFGAVGSTIAVRAFGLHEYAKNGSFSYTAIGMAILAVICLFLVLPAPVGFTGVNAVYGL